MFCRRWPLSRTLKDLGVEGALEQAVTGKKGGPGWGKRSSRRLRGWASYRGATGASGVLGVRWGGWASVGCKRPPTSPPGKLDLLWAEVCRRLKRLDPCFGRCMVVRRMKEAESLEAGRRERSRQEQLRSQSGALLHGIHPFIHLRFLQCFLYVRCWYLIFLKFLGCCWVFVATGGLLGGFSLQGAGLVTGLGS